jgi:hypothetical protein
MRIGNPRVVGIDSAAAQAMTTWLGIFSFAFLKKIDVADKLIRVKKD